MPEPVKPVAAVTRADKRRRPQADKDKVYRLIDDGMAYKDITAATGVRSRYDSALETGAGARFDRELRLGRGAREPVPKCLFGGMHRRGSRHFTDKAMKELFEYISGLTVTQGAHIGRAIHIAYLGKSVSCGERSRLTPLPLRSR